MPIGPFKDAFKQQPSLGARILLTVAVIALFAYSHTVLMDLVNLRLNPAGSPAVNPRAASLSRFFTTTTIAIAIFSTAMIWLGSIRWKKPRSGPVNVSFNHCLRCGYSRDGLEPKASCPECGLDSSGLVNPPHETARGQHHPTSKPQDG